MLHLAQTLADFLGHLEVQQAHLNLACLMRQDLEALLQETVPHPFLEGDGGRTRGYFD